MVWPTYLHTLRKDNHMQAIHSLRYLQNYLQMQNETTDRKQLSELLWKTEFTPWRLGGFGDFRKKTAVFGCLTNALAPPPIELESCSTAQTDRPD